MFLVRRFLKPLQISRILKMGLKNNDFIELDFIGKIKETGEIFDTTIEEEAKKAGLLKDANNENRKFEPLRICIGQGMVVKGLDRELADKETERDYEIELKPEDAFGKRDSKLVRIMPLSAFRQRGVEPAAGMMLALDNFLVKISAVTSGRVVADFNNPLSGKHIIYKFRIKRKIDDAKEKVEILSGLFFGKPEKVSIENNKAVIELKMKLPDNIKGEFVKKFKEILGIDTDIKEAENNQPKEEINQG